MKTKLAAFAVALLLMGTACGKKAPREARAVDFSCDFAATCDGLAVAGTLTRYTAGTLELAFEQPATVKGLTATWDGEDVTLTMLGLSFDIDPDDIPESAIGEGVVAVLDEVLYAEAAGREQNGELVFEGEVAGGAYTLVCDGESGFPRSLAIPESNLHITFTQNE